MANPYSQYSYVPCGACRSSLSCNALNGGPLTCSCSCHSSVTSYCSSCGRPPMFCRCPHRLNPPMQIYGYESKPNPEELAKLVEERVQERLKIEDKPVLTDCFIGYRIWHYNAGYLQSAFKTEYNWPHRKALTKDVYNNAGIHAVKEYKSVIPLLMAYCWPGQPTVFDPTGIMGGRKGTRGIAGAVYLWGEVVEHTGGYLAEFAYPKELFVDEQCDILTIMQLEENYGVPVSIREELNPSSNELLDNTLGLIRKNSAFSQAVLYGTGYQFNPNINSWMGPSTPKKP